ncbi:MAG: hypothetical protein IJ594_01280, partial [Oscillospiraceae bacterium]|nr:hypothetical protein [Oscillospiraceae bacterium]
MTDTKKKRKSRFGVGLALYAMILLLMILVLLVFFYFYIAAYEASRPESVMERYISDMGEDSFSAGVESFVASLDHNIQSEETSLRELQEILQNLRYAKKVSESTDDRLVYVLKAGDRVVGQVTLQQSAEKRLGFGTWSISDAQLELESLCRESEWVLPPGYQVLCNGYALDASYVVDDAVPYELLEEFYASYELPAMLRYRTGQYVGDIDVQILDPSGAPAAESALNEDVYTDNCTEEETAEIRAFCDDYILRYVTYLSGANGAHFPNLYAVLALTITDSDLYSRLYQALGGQGFASSHGD